MIKKLERIKEIIEIVYKLREDVEANKKEISNLLEEKKQLKEQFEEGNKKVDGLLEREDWTRKQFEEGNKKIDGLLERENWTRKQFEEGNKKIDGLLEREDWTRKQFEEGNKKIDGLLEREDWTRKRFEEENKKIDGLLEREDWTRRRFEQVQKEINKLLKTQEDNENFYRKMTYSQSGEDAIIMYILNFMRIPWEEVTYLDLGANHPIEMSNTYTLYEKGARGVLVEANPELIPELYRVREEDIILNKAISNQDKNVKFYVMSGDGLSTVSYEEAQIACERNNEIYIKEVYEIETIKVNQIIEQYFSKTPTILSIDLEGIEREILQSIDFKSYRPLIIILEDIPYYPYLVINNREHKVRDIMEQNNYIEYAFTGINVVFIDKEQVNKFNRTIIEEQKLVIK